ncbi:hypothetical protein [Acinetobacter sp. WCHA39]|jgi:hypothetical protein|uniref:hypothetical protein n=1 Tax=Acinetobacter sp. WCHA39 TaxID=2004648 RepID=UPI000B3CEC5A|nr:hypothetical protein [Acinetobacter sp. WCHA39]
MNAINVGDQVVMTDEDDYNSIFTVVGQPFRMYQLKGPDDLFYGRLSIQIRHATSEEITAGHRIDHIGEPNGLGTDSDIVNHNTGL